MDGNRFSFGLSKRSNRVFYNDAFTYFSIAMKCVDECIIINLVAKSFITINIWTLLLLFVSFIATCIIVVILSKSIEEEDIMLLLTIERRSGLNLVKNILKRFV